MTNLDKPETLIHYIEKFFIKFKYARGYFCGVNCIKNTAEEYDLREAKHS